MGPPTRQLFNLEACFLLDGFQSGWCTVLADRNQNFSDVWSSSNEINEASRKPLVAESGRSWPSRVPEARGRGSTLDRQLLAAGRPRMQPRLPLLRTAPTSPGATALRDYLPHLRRLALQLSCSGVCACLISGFPRLVMCKARGFRMCVGQQVLWPKAGRATCHDRALWTEEGEHPETQPQYRPCQPGQRVSPVLPRSPRENLSRDGADSLVKCQQAETSIPHLHTRVTLLPQEDVHA